MRFHPTRFRARRIKGNLCLTFAFFSIFVFQPLLAGATTLEFLSDNLSPSVVSTGYNYGEALQKSLFFYDAQRSGVLPSDNPINWKGNSATQDGSDHGIDLTGGYYDAGDHVKFGLPMASSMTLLAWGGIVYPDGYKKIGQWDHLLSVIKWGTDFLIKAHTAPHELYGQVGMGSADHAFWGPAEFMKMDRPSYKIDEKHPGSDLAGETAAAMASAAILFRESDPAYSQTLIEHAEQLFEFADQFRGIYSQSIPDAAGYYNSFSGYEDELVWAALWLYKATGTQSYLQYAIQNSRVMVKKTFTWTHSWDDKSYGSIVLLSELANDSDAKKAINDWLDYWTIGGPGGKINYTPGGLAYLNIWGSLRYTATTAFLALIYSDDLKLTGETPEREKRYRQFAVSQMDYIFGSNPNKRSYVVGFGNNPPVNAHHRSAHGSWDNSLSNPPQNRHILYGALVGGPDINDFYVDDRTDYVKNEVALDYNAGFTGAAAALTQAFGGTALEDFPRPETPGREYYVSAWISGSTGRSSQISTYIHNESGWPPAAPQLSFRYFLDLTQVLKKGYKVTDISIMSYYNEGANISKLLPWNIAKNIYYVQVSYDLGKIYPGSTSSSKKQTQITFALPSNSTQADWDPSNDWSIQGLTSKEAATQYIPVYSNGLKIYGQEPGDQPTPTPDPSPTPPNPVPSPTPTPPTPTPTPPTPSPTPTQPTPTPTPTPTPPEHFSCGAKFNVNTWRQDQSTYAVINLYLTNTSPNILTAPWTLQFKNPAYEKLHQVWNWKAQLNAGEVQGTASESWETLQPFGQNSINLGLIISGNQSNLEPQGVSINGVACTSL